MTRLPFLPGISLALCGCLAGWFGRGSSTAIFDRADGDLPAIMRMRTNPAGQAGVEPSAMMPTTFPSSGSIRGIVTDAAGIPLARARVAAEGPTRREILTDQKGRYSLDGLAPGIYAVAASRAKYATMWAGQALPFDYESPVVVGGGSSVNTDFSLPDAGAVLGHVTDELGQPRPEAMVRLFRLECDGDLCAPQPVRGVSAARTDENGGFRLHSVPDGDFLICAEYSVPPSSESGGPSTSYVQTFSPASTDGDSARKVFVAAGRLATADVRLRTLPTTLITGVVRDDEGRVVNGRPMVVRLVRNGAPNLAQAAQVHPNGTFELSAPLGPGSYIVSISVPGGGAAPAMFGQTTLALTEHQRTVSVDARVHMGGQVRGTVNCPAGKCAPGLRISARPLLFDGALIGSISAPVEPTGAFRLADVFEPSRLVVHGPEGELPVEAVQKGSASMMLSGITPHPGGTVSDISVTIAGSSVRGSVAGLPMHSAAPPPLVVVWPDQVRLGVVKPTIVRASSDGSFALRNVARGTYYAAAISAVDVGRMSTTQLRRLQRFATTISVGDAPLEGITITARTGRD